MFSSWAALLLSKRLPVDAEIVEKSLFVGIPTRSPNRQGPVKADRSHIENRSIFEHGAGLTQICSMVSQCRVSALLPQGETNEKNTAAGDRDTTVDVRSVHRFFSRGRSPHTNVLTQSLQLIAGLFD